MTSERKRVAIYPWVFTLDKGQNSEITEGHLAYPNGDEKREQMQQKISKRKIDGYSVYSGFGSEFYLLLGEY